jgi:hypothetical protein
MEKFPLHTEHILSCGKPHGNLNCFLMLVVWQHDDQFVWEGEVLEIFSMAFGLCINYVKQNPFLDG